MDDYNDFENLKLENKNVRCSDFVNESNVKKCVKIRGLPWAANKNSLVEFFDGFNL